MTWIKSAIVGSEILTLFVNTLTTDDKYSRRNMLNFTQQLEAPYLKNKRLFLDFLMAFLKRVLNLEHLQKKDEYPSRVISRIIDSERCGYLNI